MFEKVAFIVTCAIIVISTAVCLISVIRHKKPISGFLSTLYNALKSVDNILPQTDSLATIKSIVALAEQGVKAAEKLYKTGKIESHDRNERATNFVVTSLELAGIEISADLKLLISDAIEAAVNDLPKTNVK